MKRQKAALLIYNILFINIQYAIINATELKHQMILYSGCSGEYYNKYSTDAKSFHPPTILLKLSEYRAPSQRSRYKRLG